MYAVSDAFLTAVAANTRSYYWAGTITTTAGKVYEFGYSDILKGSGYISSQCCGSTEIELGITLLSEVDRYTLEDAVVEISCFLRLADGSYEEVPMGVFEVRLREQREFFRECDAAVDQDFQNGLHLYGSELYAEQCRADLCRVPELFRLSELPE